MWGRSKKPVKAEPRGYIGEITEQQQEVFNQFKQWIQMNSITENPWFTDSFLLRFCRARKFDLDNIILMFSNYMEYRKNNGLDTIVNDFDFDKKEAVMPFYPRGYMGVDKLGRPVYIERSGYINPTKIWEIVDEEYLWRSFHQSYEVLNKLHYMACSHVKGTQIQHTFSILDMSNFSIGMMNKRVYSLVQTASKITQDYYPESLGQLMIVNAPMLFTGVWSMIKGWLDEVTRKKIQLVGSSYKKELLKYIDEEQLAEFLGGQNTSSLNDDVGPWSDYEIVDGHLKDAVVGVRLKSDGPDGKVFTPQDLEQLPNYLVENARQANGATVEEVKEQ